MQGCPATLGTVAPQFGLTQFPLDPPDSTLTTPQAFATTRTWSLTSWACAVTSWHNKSPFKKMLTSCHFRTTFRTASLIARLSCHMRDFCSTVWAHTITTRPCGKRPAHSTSALTTPQAFATTRTWSLTSWACTVTSWHNIHPFCNYLLIRIYHQNPNLPRPLPQPQPRPRPKQSRQKLLPYNGLTGA